MIDKEGESKNPRGGEPKLLDQLRGALRAGHYSRRTEKTSEGGQGGCRKSRGRQTCRFIQSV